MALALIGLTTFPQAASSLGVDPGEGALASTAVRASGAGGSVSFEPEMADRSIRGALGAKRAGNIVDQVARMIRGDLWEWYGPLVYLSAHPEKLEGRFSRDEELRLTEALRAFSKPWLEV
ncbi:MAG: hypothetical protein ACREMY_28745, partial [bacterium]